MGSLANASFAAFPTQKLAAESPKGALGLSKLESNLVLRRLSEHRSPGKQQSEDETPK